MKFTKDNTIRRVPLHDQITRHIGLQILRGDTSTVENSLNTETELCRRLGVSRNLVRQAIKVLASKGLVEVRPKTGIRIRPRKEWNLLDPDLLGWRCEAGADVDFIRNLCEVRLAVEPMAAQFAALRATDEEVAVIRRHCRAMEEHIGNPELYVPADMAFHFAISAACHNELLTQMNATIGSALRATQDLVKNLPGRSAASQPLHRAVADAISRHSLSAAREAMEGLIRHAAKDLYQVFHLESFTGIESFSEEKQDSPACVETPNLNGA